jgi:acetolactate synthase-1/2/3 large subunit
VPAPTTPVVHIDIDPAELGRHYARTTPVLGDAKVVLQRMLDAGTEPRDRSAWLERVAQLRAEYFDEFRARMESDTDPMRPERLCRELSKLLPSDVLLLADTGHSGMWTGGMVDLPHPTQSYLRAAGSLGWGVPAAIGAKCGAPERPVVLFTGDGGFWYHASEIETACRWKIPVVLLVNNNHSLNQEIVPFTPAYGGRLHGRHHELWHFLDVDLASVAQSMGATGIRVTRPAELEKALSVALETDGPAVIDVVTDIDALAPLGYVPEQ